MSGKREGVYRLVGALLLALAFAAQPAAAQLKCFPSCSAADARFLVIASGTGLVTLSEERLDVQFAVPAGSDSFTLGIFDGDGGGVDLLGRAHWDLGSNVPYRFTLYAEPLVDGTGTTVVEMIPGFPSVSSLTMPNNDWIDYAIPTSSAALAPSGNYFYRLRIELLDNSVSSYNSFKLRTTGVVSIRLADQPFSYIAALRSADEARIVYPNFPTLTPTTYDGMFRFFFDLEKPMTQLDVWDGDFDRGSFDGTSPDTDDPDTPNAPFLPAWATLDAVPERVATGLGPSTGNPPDDLNPNAATLRRSPAIREDLLFPNGEIFANDNPSGNQEWELFRVSTEPFDPTQMDASTAAIPAGVYELRIQGADMGNLNALRLPSEALCVSEEFVPCVSLRPFLVGDTVFRDLDGDGVQSGDGETGIAGVEVELVGDTGDVITTATTDADGHYSFPVEAGTYTVRIADSNSEPGGPLDGAIATTPVQLTETVVDDNVLTYDFGYRGTGSLGDRVWLDRDGDGEQDAGEDGINDATVELLDGDGNVVGSTTTAGDGDYSFDRLFPGSYSVRVVASTLPEGLEATSDLDGVETPDVAAVDLEAGEERTDVDFGYRGNASLGDRVWLDADGDGVQDAGETGLSGVTVRLLDGDGGEVATTTTGADGIYTFDNLAAGTYTVSVVASTLPPGTVATYDRDGTGTPNVATVTLEAGDDRTDVDFGYRGSISLGDRVWYDTDGDGVQEAGEPGLPGTTVELLNSGGGVIATTVTGTDGFYTFANLTAGTYTVRVVASTLPVGGVAPTYDLDGTGTPNTATVTLSTAGRSDVDFGYRGTRSLGDRVWNDADGDGTQDAGEAGINGVTVRLFLGSTQVASTVTSGNGNYTFTNLPQATFTVVVDAATLPAGMTRTYDLDGVATPNQATVNLTASRTDVDFGYRTPPATCTAGYFKDHFDSASFSNNDGTRSWAGAWIESDSAGAGVSSGNVTVGSPYGGYLFLRDSPDTGTQPSAARQANLTGFASATLSFSFHVRTAVDPTDAVVVEVSNNGGTSYTILETLTGFTGTYEGTRSYNISSFIASNTRIRFRVSSGYGSSDELFKLDWVKIDASCTPATTGSIGNRVWLDSDGDGVQDSGENGINGVTVQLLNGSGTVIATATTAGSGDYTFGNLAAGSYSVRVVTSTLPAGAIQTYDLNGTATAHIAAVTLTAGQNRTDVDFGYRVQASCTASGYVKDHFSSASFSNNDGTLSWAGAWVESDSAGTGVGSGNVTVGSPYSGYLFLRDYPDTGTQPSAARQVNLSSFSSATLSFSFHVRTAVDTDDAVVIEVSNNGGSSYTVLETLKGFSGTYEGTRTYNISAYRASNTRIRFRVSNGYGAGDELFKLDWVKIDATCP